jgi:hypothetical protein
MSKLVTFRDGDLLETKEQYARMLCDENNSLF